MSSTAIVPDLEIAQNDRTRVLPASAEGPVEVWAGNNVDAYGYAGGGAEWIHLPGVATFCISPDTPGVIGAIPDDACSEEQVRDAYRRSILPLILQMRGIEVLHASAVATATGVLAICGRSGAGKSTLAHALSQRGYPVVADDAVALGVGSGGVHVLRLPFSLRLRTGLASPVERDDSGELSSLDAIVVLQSPGETISGPIELTRLAAPDAFTALLPHAYYYRLSDRGRNERLVESYLRLVASITVWNAHIRHDLAEIPGVLHRLEEDTGVRP